MGDAGGTLGIPLGILGGMIGAGATEGCGGEVPGGPGAGRNGTGPGDRVGITAGGGVTPSPGRLIGIATGGGPGCTGVKAGGGSSCAGGPEGDQCSAGGGCGASIGLVNGVAVACGSGVSFGMTAAISGSA